MAHSLHSYAASQQEELYILVSAELSEGTFFFVFNGH